MTKTLALFHAAYDHIRERLDALNLDLTVWTFERDGTFTIDGARVPCEEVEVDYLWISQHINADGGRQDVFDVIQRCKRVGVLQTFNAGLDDPNYKKIADKGTTICNSSAQAVAISEFVIGQVMNVYQPFALQHDQQARREWKFTPYREIWHTHWLVIGYGPIGKALAKRLRPFETTTTVVRRSATPAGDADRTGTMADLPEFLPDADVIVIACPLKDETRGFANSNFFAKAKDGAILVNIARGPLVDDPALIDALDSSKIERAVLDVFHTEPLPADDPLWTHPKVNLTPHTSFSGSGVFTRWDQLFLDNIQRFCNDEPLEMVFDPADLV